MTNYDDAVRKALAESGVILLPDGSVELDAAFKGPKQPTQAQIDLWNSTARVRASRSHVELLWAHNLRHTTERLLAGDSTDPDALATVFFLRVHGWLVDFPKHYAMPFEELEKGPSARGSVLSYLRPIREVLSRIKAAFAEDELLYIEYRRDIESHVHAGNYDPQWNKKRGKVADKYASSLTGTTYDRADVSKRIESVRRQHGSDGTRIAIAFAARVRSDVRALQAAMVLFDSPRCN